MSACDSCDRKAATVCVPRHNLLPASSREVYENSAAAVKAGRLRATYHPRERRDGTIGFGQRHTTICGSAGAMSCAARAAISAAAILRRAVKLGHGADPPKPVMRICRAAASISFAALMSDDGRQARRYRRRRHPREERRHRRGRQGVESARRQGHRRQDDDRDAGPHRDALAYVGHRGRNTAGDDRKMGYFSFAKAVGAIFKAEDNARGVRLASPRRSIPASPPFITGRTTSCRRHMPMPSSRRIPRWGIARSSVTAISASASKSAGECRRSAARQRALDQASEGLLTLGVCSRGPESNNMDMAAWNGRRRARWDCASRPMSAPRSRR